MQCANKQLTQWLRLLIKLKLSKWLKVDNWRVREFAGASCQAVELQLVSVVAVDYELVLVVKLAVEVRALLDDF